jgi:hypothetical protein
MAEAEAEAEMETILMAEVDVNCLVNLRTGFHHASYVDGQIIQSSSATRGLIQHTWGKKNLQTQPTPMVLTPIGGWTLEQLIT